MTEKVTDGILVLLAVVSFFLSIHGDGRAGTTIDGTALYSSHCSRCHGPLPAKSRVTTARIVQAISTVSVMRPLYGLSLSEIKAIATAFSTPPSPSTSLPNPICRPNLSPPVEISFAGRNGRAPACWVKGS
ncbi:hypothetical protein [Geomonas sp.]|uniref:hypothetical protein n=1 Tax=Geomonas sp. TaxID=2651584 RepID=UPI002B4887FC|nr:hypothetical protein [Geomonas sp.]HJV36724.1 hypothetical protein [Geomonas sp.]